MKTTSPVLLLALLSIFPPAGCGDDPPPPPVDDLTVITEGVRVQPAGCPFSVTTPSGTSTPVEDDGKAQAPPRSLHLSWAGDPSTSVSIVWVSDVQSRGTQVEFGPSASYGQSARGFSFAYPTDFGGVDKPTMRVHEVHLCGLQPGTVYHYRAGAPGAMSGDHSFATAPDAAGAPVRFIVAGDSRGDAQKWAEVLQAAAAGGADFILYTGDAIDFGTIQAEWDAWFAAGAQVLPSLPMMFALGNHELFARHAFAQLAQPGNEQWYSFDYGDIHFTVLNDTPENEATIEGEQVRFLDEDLGKTGRRWKVAMHHKAIYSASNHGSQLHLQAAWMPLYDKHAVDVVFNGHDHDYERSKPMRAGRVAQPGQGTTYFVNGGGGAPLYAAGTQSFTAFSKSTFAYSVVEVVGGQMTVTAYEVAGGASTQIDTVTFNK